MTQSLLRRAGKAVALNALGNWFGMAGSMLSLVFIARLLSPMDFGVYGMTLVIFAIPEIFASGSLNDALIQRRDLQAGHISSVFMQSLVLAAVFWIGINVGAPLIAHAFDHAELVPMIRLFSISLFIGALTSVPAALLQRDLRYSEITLVDVIGTIVAAVVGIILAFTLQSAWALIYMELARRVVRLFAFTAMAKWRPSFKSSWVETRELTRFNSLNMATKVVVAADGTVSRGLVGAILGPAALGMFNMAVRLLDQAKAAFVTPFAAVSLPVAAQTQHDLPTLYRAIEGAMKLAALIAYPTFIGACVVAPVAIPVVFGDQWIPAVPTIQVFLLMGLRTPTTAFNSGVLNGVGRVDWTFKISLVGLVLTVLAVGATIHISLEAVALAMFGQTLVTWALGAYAVKSSIGFPMKRQVIAGSSAFFASLIMGLIVWVCMQLIQDSVHALLEMVILVLVGVVAYVGALSLLSPMLAKRIVQALIMVAQGRREEAIMIAKGAV
jgi:lipopolysaccharide exporter